MNGPKGLVTASMATPVDHALDQLRVAFDHLVKAVEDGGLDHYDLPGLLRFIADFERVQNLAELVHHRVVADCDRRQVADQLNARNTRTLLAGLLRISEREAGRRVRAATAVGDRANLQGALIGAARPALAAAQRAGEVNPEQVSIIERALDQVDRPGYDPAEIAAAEQTLTGYAADFGPRDLRRIATKLVEVLDPDGTLPAEELAQDRRHLYLTANRDGTYTVTGRLTGCVGAAMQAVLSPLAKPRIPVDDDGTTVTGNGPRDPRTGGQRLHDALDDACARLLRAGGLPASGGTPATVIVTISAEDLLARTGYGETSDGTLIATGRLLQLANEADILPAVLTATGECLMLGRSRRIATTAQTYALIARDGGCSFPGCTHPPEWCDRHHITEWIDGGETNLNNLTLLCRYHHTRYAAHGWTCRLNPTTGLPEWVPPRWINPHQTPLTNDRITRRHLPPNRAGQQGPKARLEVSRC